MNKKHIILTIIIAGLLTAMLCIDHNGNKEKKDSQSATLAIQSLEDEPSEEFADTEEYDDSTINLTIVFQTRIFLQKTGISNMKKSVGYLLKSLMMSSY